MTVDPPNEEPRKERLQRLARIFGSSPIYFVTACTFNRRSILADNAVHQAFLRFAEAGENHGAYVGAYVIMPNHVHLFVALAPDRTLSAWINSLKNALSKSLRAIGIQSPHWQKGFLITFCAVMNHIHRSGNMFGTIPSVPDWSKLGKNGHLGAKFGGSNIANGGFVSTVIDRRYNRAVFPCSGGL